MSFVQSLRMRNMFPVNSNLGSAKIDLSGRDPMYEVIDAYNEQVRQQQMSRPQTGLQQVASRGNSKMRASGIGDESEPLRFGGVTNYGNNPGGDILNRSKRSAEDLYASYDDPKNIQDVSGPSNDQIHLDRYFGKKLAEKKVDIDLEEAKLKAEAAKNVRDARGWKTVLVTDPTDPSKQVNARINEITGEVQPIRLPNDGIVTRPGSKEDILKRQDLENEKSNRRQSVKAKAESAMELMNQLLDDKEQLTSEAQYAVGKSSIGNFIPTTPMYSGSTKIDRLKNNQILDLIGEMKAQSKTGATGFGAMNLRELGVLEKAASMLDTGLDEETFRKELVRIKTKLNEIMTDVKVGDIKQFPNGKRGKWDGEGWEPIE